MKKQIPYITCLFIAFYLLPLLIKDTGSAMFILLIIVPIVVLICSLINGKKHGFSWQYLITIPILFTPTIFIFYNESAIIYVVIYLLIAIFAVYLGKTFNKKERKNAKRI